MLVSVCIAFARNM
uniref:Uncharacterized protein n=1 Tax=Arundo donax TaxID=35708 RepID=A0A0A9GA20_ARUDO